MYLLAIFLVFRMVASASRTTMLGELCGFLPLRPFTSRHGYDMHVRWLHLSTADCYLVRLSYTTNLWICLFRSLSVSPAGFRRRFRLRSSESYLAEAGMVG